MNVVRNLEGVVNYFIATADDAKAADDAVDDGVDTKTYGPHCSSPPPSPI